MIQDIHKLIHKDVDIIFRIRLAKDGPTNIYANNSIYYKQINQLLLVNTRTTVFTCLYMMKK